MDSILTSVKKMLGITEEYEHFDPDLIMHINSVFMILNQLGVGPTEGFTIQDETSVWTDFIPDDDPRFAGVKSYVPLKVKLLFDPPDRSSVINATNEMITELEWRLNLAHEESN